MANHKSAIKRHRQSLKRAARNKAVRTRIKNVVKNFHAVAVTKEVEKVSTNLSTAQAILGKAAQKGVIHWRKAARKTSRLAKAAQKALAA